MGRGLWSGRGVLPDAGCIGPGLKVRLGEGCGRAGVFNLPAGSSL